MPGSKASGASCLTPPPDRQAGCRRKPGGGSSTGRRTRSSRRRSVPDDALPLRYAYLSLATVQRQVKEAWTESVAPECCGRLLGEGRAKAAHLHMASRHGATECGRCGHWVPREARWDHWRHRDFLHLLLREHRLLDEEQPSKLSKPASALPVTSSQGEDQDGPSETDQAEFPKAQLRPFGVWDAPELSRALDLAPLLTARPQPLLLRRFGPSSRPADGGPGGVGGARKRRPSETEDAEWAEAQAPHPFHFLNGPRSPLRSQPPKGSLKDCPGDGRLWRRLRRRQETKDLVRSWLGPASHPPPPPSAPVPDENTSPKPKRPRKQKKFNW